MKSLQFIGKLPEDFKNALKKCNLKFDENIEII